MCGFFFGDRATVRSAKIRRPNLWSALRLAPPPRFHGNCRALGYQQGSASQGLQLLRSLGAINEAEQKEGATRGVAYAAELSLRQLVTGVLQERLAPLASAGARRLKRLKELAAQAPENTKFYLDRTKQIENWRKRFTTITPLLTALLGHAKKKSR